MASSDARIHFLLVLSCTSYLASPAAAISYGEIIPDEPRNTCVVLINGTCQDLTCQDMGTMSRPLGVASAIFCCSKRGLPHGPDARSLGIHLTRQLFLGSNETCSGTTHSCSPILRRFQEEPIVLFDQNCSADLLGLDFFSRLDPPSYRGTQRRRIVPRGSTRRLLDGATAGAHGRRGPRNQQHVATHRQLASPPRMEQQQLLQASVLGAAVAVAGAALLWLILICAVAGLVLCCIRTKRRRRSTAAAAAAAAIELEPEDVDDEPLLAEPQQPQPHQVLHRELGPRQFRYRELAAATGNFAEERRIGRGGFGPVYRGYLKDQDRHVAIKVLSPEQSVQGRKEFLAEVTVISRLRHRNVVQLVGWCDGRRGLALVYELVPGGSLDTHLYHLNTQLAWPQRYNIALGLGSALLYLHTGCDQCVVHGDIKPANVMLDTSRNAKLGDFGLARLTDHGSEPRTTRVVAGTVGYIDPELVNSRRPSTEADVYSFGVVLLEIACGRRPTTTSSGPPPDHQVSSPAPPLLASVRDTYNRGLTLLDAADPRLHGEFNDLQMERLILTGLWCAHHDPARRPSIGQAMGVLRSEDAELPVLPALATSGSGQIRSLEGRAYGDLSAQSSASAYASTGTEYLTSAHTLLEEITYASPSTM